ncbi:MAG: YihY/virulence factor BrkB family protein [bacterium]|nr:YihY/virulence factor BrkB family protein [bacterium]
MINVGRVLKQAVTNFTKNDLESLSAGLAFYSVLSLVPLLVLLLAATELLSNQTSNLLIAQINAFVGPNAGDGLALVIQSTRELKSGGKIGFFGAVMMLIAATMAFAHLRHALNKIWQVNDSSSFVANWLLARATSLVLASGIGLLLLVSMVITAVQGYMFPATGLWVLLNIGVSLFLNTLLFGFIFWLLPSITIGWRDVALGAVVTAILFEVGKWAIGLYLSYADIGSLYGTAGSILVLLVWIYYASIVFFFGAEITHAWALNYGSLKKRVGYD